ncbi:MAG TPA: hypothetical protein VGP44_03245 [Gemmatimonadales bacterium]|nr:hypothetical protein [Gemmatimonadales bacterium]
MMYPSTPVPGCAACAEVAGSVLAPGGVILDDGLWFVSHHTGPFTDPGELIVKTRRQCIGTSGGGRADLCRLL